jgi:hypothetical protein
VTDYWNEVGHWKRQHQRTECCLLKTEAYKGDYRGSVGTAVMIVTGDYGGFDDGVILWGRRIPPNHRAVEVAGGGSSSSSLLITTKTQTFRN